MDNTIKFASHIDYVGTELQLFRHAINWKRYFSDILLPYISGDVLEVGAGIGTNTPYLARRPHLIKSWLFLEPDRKLADEISSNVSSIPVGSTRIVNGVITDLEGDQFDTIIYIDVLEHIQNSVDEIRRAKTLLKPDGYLIILVPAFNFLFTEFDKKIGHFRRYHSKLLLTEVDGLLKKERVHYLDSLGFFASLANKLFLHKNMPSLQNVKFWDKYLVPLSRFTDLLVGRSFGKSLIGVFKNAK